MCRVLAYLGRPILVEDLLYAPDNSLVAQVYDPEFYSILNLGGFGMAAWGAEFAEPDVPLHYRTPSLPPFDRNLRSLARKVTVGAALAHIRAVYYDDSQTLTAYNVHPFRFDGASAVLGMNGTLTRFGEMRYDLLDHIRPEIARHIEGTTDSEWFYALFLSHLPDPAAPSTPEQLEQATEAALRIIRDVRGRHGIDMESEMNVVVADGRTIVATRFNYDYGWYSEEETYYSKRRRYEYTSLWCTAGGEFVQRDGEWIMSEDERVQSVIIASEPVTKDSSTWVEVPEYAMLTASLRHGVVEIRARELLV
jgi:glutamine amidotransferase